jgi:hypothetical protein
MPLQFKAATPATRRAKILLLGEAGTGKSHAALTFPKPAVIDAEGSIDWFADRFQFVSVNTKSYRDVQDILADIRAGNVPCETVVIDSLTTIYNGLLAAVAGERDDLRPMDWGRIKRKFSAMLDELYLKLDKHVVCIGWIKPEYAKQGTTVNGKRVAANELVQVGEQFDGDKKTSHAFDFIFKLEGNDGKRTRATVLKSRSGALKAGQTIEDFSFKTIEALLPKGDHIATGMSDEEQTTRDAGLLADPDPAPTPPPMPPELAEAWKAKGGLGTFKEFAARVLGAEKATVSLQERAKLHAAILSMPEPRTPTPIESLPQKPALTLVPDAQPAAPPEAPPPSEPFSEAQDKLYFALCGELKFDAKRRADFNELIGGKKSHQGWDKEQMTKAIDTLNKRLDAANIVQETLV